MDARNIQEGKRSTIQYDGKLALNLSTNVHASIAGTSNSWAALGIGAFDISNIFLSTNFKEKYLLVIILIHT